jgi:hypothetical protein
MNEIVLASATRQLELAARGQISVASWPRRTSADRAAQSAMNALADFDAERVRAQARQLDACTRKRGALHGLPVTIKSSIATAGYRCEIGSLLHKGEIPAKMPWWWRGCARGSVDSGHDQLPEFLMAYETANLLHGRTRNPWDLSARRADRAEASRRPSRRECPRRGWAATAAARCACPRTSPASARSSPRRGAFRARASAAVRGTVLDSGRDRAHGAHHGDVALLFRTLSGQDPLDPVSPPVALRDPSPDELRANHRIL